MNLPENPKFVHRIAKVVNTKFFSIYRILKILFKLLIKKLNKKFQKMNKGTLKKSKGHKKLLMSFKKALMKIKILKRTKT